jgi:hypothetical protein
VTLPIDLRRGVVHGQQDVVGHGLVQPLVERADLAGVGVGHRLLDEEDHVVVARGVG